jgi:uncharacterized peroxidase-related enzyme
VDESTWGPDESYLDVDPALQGIRALFSFRPETAIPMRALAQTLLRGPSPLSPGDRELIATYVSARNRCHFCASSHGGAAAALIGDTALASLVFEGQAIPVEDKLTALLAVAAAVQTGGQHLTPDIVATAREYGVTEIELHDAVLVAAAFSMYNRYVDALRPHVPDDEALYVAMGDRLASDGYA